MFIINKKEFYIYENKALIAIKRQLQTLKNSKYNWEKLLLLSSVNYPKTHIKRSLILRVLIIDDKLKLKRKIYGSCRNLWNNKEHRTVKGLNIVSQIKLSIVILIWC